LKEFLKNTKETEIEMIIIIEIYNIDYLTLIPKT
jgi:hypothetical protein